MAQRHDIGARKHAHAEAERERVGTAKRAKKRRPGTYRDWCRTPGHPAGCRASECR